MKRKTTILIISSLIISFSSCEKLLMEPNPSTNNISIYEEYWKVFNEKYAMFEFKNVDWKHEYETNKIKVNNSISEDSLFKVLGEMTLLLRDSHTSLFDYSTNDRFAFYDNEAGFLKNLNQKVIDTNYLNANVQKQGNGMRYRMLESDVGYIEYRDFDEKVTDKMMDKMLTYFKDTKGIILDVRGNGGGDPYFSYLMASHFADKETYIGIERFRTGPNPEDFSDSRIYLKPSKGINYTKPLVVLTNRQCFSATTTLIYYLNPFAHVTFVGALTGGGSGSVADGRLANGWEYSLSSSEFIDWEGRHLDDGFEPDIPLNLDTLDTSKDEIIEKAVAEILK